MNRTAYLATSVFLFAGIAFTGCAKTNRVIPVPTAPAHEKLIRLLKEDYNLKVMTRAFNNTLWIYLPLENPIFQIASGKNGPSKSPVPSEKPRIYYLDGEFLDHTFNITYDIRADTSYPDNKGLENKYSEEFSAKQRHVLGAITRAYGEIEQAPGKSRYVEKVAGDVDFWGEKKNVTHKELVHAYVKTAPVPDFFVIVMADIKNGIEIRMQFYLQDLRRSTVDAGFAEEYLKRIIIDQPVGRDSIIGDTTGSYIDARDITWGEFLVKQMLYRAMIKYTFSSKPPLADARQQLLTIAAEAIQAYDFHDYSAVHLTDLNAHNEYSTNPAEINSQNVDTARPAGRLHHLTFEIGAPENETQ